MSRYLGKLLLDSGRYAVSDFDSVSVKYSKSSDRFYFRVRAGGDRTGFNVGKNLVLEMCQSQNQGMLPFQYHWSAGYKVRPKKGVEYLGSLIGLELDYFGGRKELIMSGALNCDADFLCLCVIQHLYCLSGTFLNAVIRMWKRKNWGREDSRWLELVRRSDTKKGRKKGSQNLTRNSGESESLDEVLLRCSHNKKVAIMRGYPWLYLDACKEECLAKGEKFSNSVREKCLKEYNDCRKMIS